MGPIGVQELLVIASIGVLIFGPRQLPKLGRGLSRSLLIFARGGCAVILCDSLGGRLLLGFEITEG